jgi:DNA modification methylase
MEKDIFISMTYQLHQQDCVSWMQTQPDDSVDIILTSPPYNFEKSYNTYVDQRDDYRTWLGEWIQQGCRILKPGGRFIVNIQPKFTHNEPYHYWIHQHMEQQNMIWYGERIWNKNAISGYRGAAGSMGTPSKPYLWYSTEYIQIFSKHSTFRETKRSQSLITIEEQVAWARHHVWDIAPARQKDHPAQMPIALAERLLKFFARQSDLVYDPFAGVGTTLLAAKQLGLPSIGTEIDADYCNIIHQRMT